MSRCLDRSRRACIAVALGVASSAPLAVVTLALLLPSVAGCRKTDPLNQEQDLAPDKMQAIMQADKVISEGERMTQEGVRLRNEGKVEEGDQMIRDGEKKKAQGEQMKAQALMMK
jgi:hypothetical protein